MPTGTKAFGNPRSLGSNKKVKVVATRRMVHEGRSILPKDVFEVEQWQVRYWLTFPDPGIKVMKGAGNTAPSKPEVKGDASEKAKAKKKKR